MRLTFTAVLAAAAALQAPRKPSTEDVATTLLGLDLNTKVPRAQSWQQYMPGLGGGEFRRQFPEAGTTYPSSGVYHFLKMLSGVKPQMTAADIPVRQFQKDLKQSNRPEGVMFAEFLYQGAVTYEHPNGADGEPDPSKEKQAVRNFVFDAGEKKVQSRRGAPVLWTMQRPPPPVAQPVQSR